MISKLPLSLLLALAVGGSADARPGGVALRSNGSASQGVSAIPDLQGSYSYAASLTAPDGVGGMYVVWSNRRDDSISRIYVQHLSPQGEVVASWPKGGLAPTSVPGSETVPLAVTDGFGGLIVAWNENHDVGFAPYIQRVSPAGQRMWGEAGVQLAPTSTRAAIAALSPDSAGGATAIWLVPPSAAEPDERVMALRLTASGYPARNWPYAGVALAADPTNHFFLRALPDGLGGTLVTWRRTVFDLDQAGFVQRVTGDGVVKWTPGAVAWPLNSLDYDLASDGAGGAFVAQTAYTGITLDIAVQHYDSSGTAVWPSPGKFVAPDTASDPRAAGEQSLPRLSPDGAGGAYVAWCDTRAPGDFGSIYAGHIDSTGAMVSGWPKMGRWVGAGQREYAPSVQGDTNGVTFAWRFPALAPSTGFGLAVQKLAPDGGLGSAWPEGGVALANDSTAAQSLSGDGARSFVEWPVAEPDQQSSEIVRVQRLGSTPIPPWSSAAILGDDFDSQFHPIAALQPDGVTILAWQQRGTGGWDIMAQRLDASGNALGPTIPVCTAPGNQSLPVVAIGPAGSWWAAWIDARSGDRRVYAQRFDSLGAPQWSADGVEVSGALTHAARARIFPAPDRVYVVWSDITPYAAQIRGQLVSSAGAALWGPNGVALLPSPYAFSVAEDGTGGLIVAGGYGTGAVAQRIPPSGVSEWISPAGAVNSNHAGVSSIVPDGTGGAYFLWDSSQYDFLGNADIIGQHLDASGMQVAGWPADGLVVASAAGSQLSPVAAASNGDAIVAWSDLRGPYEGVFAQKVTSGAELLWGASGIPISSGAGRRVLEAVMPDGAGGAIFSWLDGSGSSWDLHAQRLSAAGEPRWTMAGIPVCTAPELQSQPTVAADGAGGAVFAWQDSRDLPVDRVVAQRVTPNGLYAWNADGLTSTTTSLVEASAEGGHALLTWSASSAGAVFRLERRESATPWARVAELISGGDRLLRFEDATVLPGHRYGYRLAAIAGDATWGEAWVSVPLAPSLALELPRPNPAAGAVTLSFALPRPGDAEVRVIDVAGRETWMREVGALGAGPHTVTLPAGALSPGVYVVTLVQDQRAVHRRICVLR